MKNVFSFLLSLVAVDMATKYWVYTYVPTMSWMHPVYPYGGYEVIESFWGGISLSINHVQNKGAAWGMFAKYSDWLFLLRIIIIATLVIYTLILTQPSVKRRFWLLVLAGAVGNTIDYFLYGYVIDMIHFNFWGYTFALFNCADIYISVGVGCLMLQSFFTKHVAVHAKL